jgi:hypothetical protein
MAPYRLWYDCLDGQGCGEDRPAPIGLIRYPPSHRHTEVATLAYHGGRASRPLAEASHEVRCRDEGIPPRLLAGFRSVGVLLNVLHSVGERRRFQVPERRLSGHDHIARSPDAHGPGRSRRIRARVHPRQDRRRSTTCHGSRSQVRTTTRVESAPAHGGDRATPGR